jgi:hypothetical protein
MSSSYFRATALAASCALIVSCTPAPPATGGFLGATSSQSGFTSAPGGCVYSFLFDNFALRRAAPTAGAPTAEPISQSRTASLNAPAHVAGANVTVEVRGAIISSGGATGQLEIAFAGGSQTIDLTSPAEGGSEPNFTHTFTAPAVNGANELRVTATLATDPANEAEIQIDSVDVAIADAPFCQTAAE